MAIIIGTTGNDTIIGGSVSPGVEVITPPTGPFVGDDDLILALAGDDAVDPDAGADTAFLDDGDDRFIWDPGEGSDVVRGGQGTDTLEFNGSDAAEQFTISDTAQGAQLFRNVGNILMDLNGVERIELNGLGGDDGVDASALTEPISLVVNGGRGNDSAILGPADDRFIWNPGDGDDVVDGRDGTDTLEFNGADATEEFVISDAEGGRVELFRDVGDILMNLTNIERIEVDGLGGNDRVDATSLTQNVQLIIDTGAGDDAVTSGPGSDTIASGAGSDIMFGGGGGDRFGFAAETSNGVVDLDTIGDYDEAEGDVIDLSAVGQPVTSAADSEGLLVTLAGDDGDQLFLASVATLDDVTLVL